MTTSIHPSQVEAIAIAIRESAPGDIVAVHDAACASEDGGAFDPGGCTCRPLELVIGAVA